MIRKLKQIFDKARSPDKQLVKGVLENNLSKVQDAFAKGASPDAVHDYRFRGDFAIGVSGGRARDPVIITALKRSSIEIVKEILAHNPNQRSQRWASQAGVTGYLRKDLLQEAEEHAAYRGSRDKDAGAKLEAVKKYLNKTP